MLAKVWGWQLDAFGDAVVPTDRFKGNIGDVERHALFSTGRLNATAP